MHFETKEQYTMDDLREITTILRGENGCPWDRAQTHQSTRKNLIEETYEVVEAIDKQDEVLLREELGDLLLQVVFHAQMEEENSRFTMDDVITDICKKLVFRHPHVFGDTDANDEEEALVSWEQSKKKSKKYDSYTAQLQAVPTVLPALMRAEKVLHRASRVGVKCENTDDALTLLEDDVAGLFQAMELDDLQQIEHKMSQILLHSVNISSFFHFDCEKLLTNATEQFINRFDTVEQYAVANQLDLAEMEPEKVMQLWQTVK